MNIYVKVVFLCIGLLGFSLVYATEKKELIKSYDETLEVSRKVMGFIEKGDYTGAYNAAKKYWPLPAHEIDALAYQTNQQMPLVLGRFGKFVEVEFVSRQKAGESFAREWYIQKFDKHALVWLFTYYYGKEGWSLNAVEFSDDINVLFY